MPFIQRALRMAPPGYTRCARAENTRTFISERARPCSSTKPTIWLKWRVPPKMCRATSVVAIFTRTEDWGESKREAATSTSARA